jgi:hypothetical protein
MGRGPERLGKYETKPEITLSGILLISVAGEIDWTLE